MGKKSREPRMKKPDYFGGGRFEYLSPKKVTENTKIINFFLTFEEALELSIAIQGCLLKLNKYNRATSEGKRKVMLIAAHMKTNRIDVLQDRLKKGTLKS